MIIGHGDIARAIPPDVDRADRIWFASGVSNSREIPASAYTRERRLLLEQPRDFHLIYFSSLCVFDPCKSLYGHHKRNMEMTIRDMGFLRYTIFRLGNITWGDNPHTLINYLRAHPKAELRDEWRYICDLDEFQHWLRLIPEWSCEMNVPGRRMKVKDIYQEFVLNERIAA